VARWTGRVCALTLYESICYNGEATTRGDEMATEQKLEERRQRAAQMLLESGVVTPALDDDQAEVLLDWALAQVGTYALSSQGLGEEQANGKISHGVARVRLLMGMVNDIIERWYELDRVQVVERLTKLMSAAMDLEGREVE